MRVLRAKKPKEQKPKKAKVLIYGPPGVGKTWTSLDFPDCIFLDAEGGATEAEYTDKLDVAGALYLGQSESADFASVIEEIKTLAMVRHDRRTVVLDSFTKLFNNSIAREEERLSDAGETVAYGNEKKPAVKCARRLVTWLDKLDMNVIVICHEKPLWKNGEPCGETFDGWDKLAYELDLTLQISKRGPERIATVRKSRLSGFPDGDSFTWSYDEFASRYGREQIEGDVVTLDPATDEQSAAMKRAQDKELISSEIVSKWFDKAGVDCWEDMDSITIQKCINFVTKGMNK